MTIQVNDTIPEVTIAQKTADGIQPVNTKEYFAGRKVALFAVPGAFTPTCSAQHLPGFLDKLEDLKAKGVDAVACMAVNDPFVMDAWGKHQGADGKIDMLADGSAVLTKALGLELDLTDKGLGVRSQRFSMLVDDGVVKALNVDEGGKFEVSSAEHMLGQL